MKPAHEIVTREGLIEFLSEHGFKEWLPSPKSQVMSLRRYDANQKKYASCFVFPTESADQKKCAGFAGIGTVEAGKPIGRNFTINYGTSTYGKLYELIREDIEPFIGKII